MCHLRVRRWLCCLAVVTLAGCTIGPPRGAPIPPSAQVLPTDARALAYGSTTAEVLQNPAVSDKIRALFGRDWMPATVAGGPLALGAAAYFDQGGPVGMVRVGGRDYIAVSGCVPGICESRHVLLLIETDGSRLLSRLDEGGFVHYYGFGSEGVTKDTAPMIVDSGYRALYGSGKPFPTARS
jgi:hypothetical protein